MARRRGFSVSDDEIRKKKCRPPQGNEWMRHWKKKCLTYTWSKGEKKNAYVSSFVFHISWSGGRLKFSFSLLLYSFFLLLFPKSSCETARVLPTHTGYYSFWLGTLFVLEALLCVELPAGEAENLDPLTGLRFLFSSFSLLSSRLVFFTTRHSSTHTHSNTDGALSFLL